jgi:hypothetical protein
LICSPLEFGASSFVELVQQQLHLVYKAAKHKQILAI